MDPYSEAHLFVAAIRVLQHKKRSPAAVEDLCRELDISVEGILAIGRKLEKLSIVTISEDPFTIKFGIADHLEIEKLPRQKKAEDGLSKDLEKFLAKKKDMDKKVEAIQADLKKKKQDLQSDFEARLRQELSKTQKKG